MLKLIERSEGRSDGDGLVSPVDEGTPQGGSAFTVAQYLVLDELDRELERVVTTSCVMPTTVTFMWAANERDSE